MQAETLKQQISAAKGEVDAELVLKRAKVVNREYPIFQVWNGIH